VIVGSAAIVIAWIELLRRVCLHVMLIDLTDGGAGYAFRFVEPGDPRTTAACRHGAPALN
jgi:hypothetical protein